MPRRARVVEQGRRRGTDIVGLLQREFVTARADRGLTQAAVAAAVGVDRSWISRIERGKAADLGIVTAAELLSAVGLELSARAFPSSGPLRDSAHAALLARLRDELHPSLAWAVEVPLPIVGDLRAWDAIVSGGGWLCGVEAETRPHDIQALQRRIALKQRDGQADFVVLLLSGTRHNRSLLRDHGDQLYGGFPVGGRVALDRLRSGADPGGNAIIVL
jgi:transcriptional regulator with XRE-family HTH domain